MPLPLHHPCAPLRGEQRGTPSPTPPLPFARSFRRLAGTAIALRWRPAAFALTTIEKDFILPAVPVPGEAGPRAVPNVVELLAAMRDLSEGLVARAEVLR